MKVLVTGVAGFIGMHVATRLLKDGHEVKGLDNLNNYYDVKLKLDRLKNIEAFQNFSFGKVDLKDEQELRNVFSKFLPEVVINLAAQAGVRNSLNDPLSYINSNICGFMNVLESCRHHNVKHLIYASSSSVYGKNKRLPFAENQNVDHPLAIYGATKKANELFAHSYSHLFKLPTTGLRFFTVYGPWGRPDMALFKFTDAIFKGQPINIFNNGFMKRDFTYIDDVVESINRLLEKPPGPDLEFDPMNPDPGLSDVPWRIFNIGNSQSIGLMEFVEIIEQETGIQANKNFLKLHSSDVEATASDTSRLSALIGYQPQKDLRDGIKEFLNWYRWYYQGEFS